MVMKTTPNYGIRYPDKNEPPTISTHLANIALDIDSTMKTYQTTVNADIAKFKSDETAARTAFQTASQAQWAAWKAPMDSRMAAIEAALVQQGWGTPVAITGTLFTPATGYTAIAGSSGVKVGNVCAFVVKFQKAADPAIVAGSSGNLATPINIGTLTTAMPKPSAITPFSTADDGFMLAGTLNTSRQLLISALAPNVNLPKTYTMTLGGLYLYNPTVP